MRLNPMNGSVVYSTLISYGDFSSISDLAMNAAGEVFATGQAGSAFPVSPGFATQVPYQSNYFVARLDSTGTRAIYSSAQNGGTRIAVTSAGEAVTVLSTMPPTIGYATTPGAYQRDAPFSLCSGSRAFAFPCAHQVVTKIDPTGARVVARTLLSGKYLDIPSAISLDPEGNIYLTGSTTSSDYPVTADAYQSENHATGLPRPPPDPIPLGFSLPDTRSGYLSILSADLSSLLYSTYFGGSVHDSLLAMDRDSTGNLMLAGVSHSPDLPGTGGYHPACVPPADQPNASRGFVLQFDTGKREFSQTRLLEGAGTVPSSLVFEGRGAGWALANTFDADAAIFQNWLDTPQESNAWLYHFANFLDGTGPLQCVQDAVDATPRGGIASGELLSLYGRGFGVSDPQASDTRPGQPLPESLDGLRVSFNGRAAAMLYASDGQINVVVPDNSPAPLPSLVTMTIERGAILLASRQVWLNAASPGAYIRSFAKPTCDLPLPFQLVYPIAAALNEDGIANDCGAPATLGSIVHVLVEGVGFQGVSIYVYANSAQLLLPVDIQLGGRSLEVVETRTAAGYPTGTFDVSFRLPQSGASGLTPITLSVAGQPLHPRPSSTASFLIWVAAP